MVWIQSPSPLCRLHSCNKHPTPGMQIRNQSGLKVETISGFFFFFFPFGTICIITGIIYFSILNLSFYEMVINWFQWMLWQCVCQAANTLLLERLRKYKWHSYFCHYFCAIGVKNIYIYLTFLISLITNLVVTLLVHAFSWKTVAWQVSFDLNVLVCGFYTVLGLWVRKLVLVLVKEQFSL